VNVYLGCTVRGDRGELESTRAIASAITALGRVHADKTVISGDADLGRLRPDGTGTVLPLSSYVIAAAPLGEARARGLLAADVALAASYIGGDEHLRARGVHERPERGDGRRVQAGADARVLRARLSERRSHESDGDESANRPAGHFVLSSTTSALLGRPKSSPADRGALGSATHSLPSTTKA
jgi:hypothetical protein